MDQNTLEMNPGNLTGIELLIRKYRQLFRIPENLNHYTKKDFQSAERKFVKWALAGGEPRRADLLTLVN